METTVVIPSHPARLVNGMTQRAVESVLKQTRPATGIIVENDLSKAGAGPTRHSGLMKVTTPWVAFLDSDDEFLPVHLERLSAHAEVTGADYVYSWYEVVGGNDPTPQNFGRPFDPANPFQTTIVTLVKTELAQEVGFLDYNTYPAQYGGEDWFFTEKCLDRGARIVHLPEKTWLWHHHGQNSSGMPYKGDAR